MASILSCPGSVILFLAYLGICYTELTTDRRQPHLNIFHHSCALKRDEGPCKALKERFYFDTDTRRCERFEYGGCQGNANNFESLEACEEMCVVTANKSPCHLEDEPGPCRGLVPRYFFNRKTQACQRFFYGGCFGNANNFKTIQSCQDTCQRRNDTQERRDNPEPREVVKPTTETLIKDDKDSAALLESERQLQPKPESHAVFFLQDCLSAFDKGHCEGSEKRYAYNRATKRCETFYYSGCGGNKNNFILRKHCIKACRPDHSRRKQIRIKTRKSHILLQSA